MEYKLTSEFYPTGDQPEAIKQLVEGINNKMSFQTLLGVTGSGKTFTVANVIQQIQRPTLVLSHNKTLAAQLFGEFKQFFPNNAVEYFVSYYDYYQPEAFIPSTNTYIEKDLAINDEIEKFRLSTTSSLLSGRRDVIVVSSVSCIYGIGNPAEFHKNTVKIKKGLKLNRNKFLRLLVNSLYSRTETEFKRGNFRVKGDTVDVNLAYADYSVRIVFFGDEIEEITTFETSTGKSIETFDSFIIYPANIFVTSPETLNQSIAKIQLDLGKQVDYYNETGKKQEAKRLYDRVTHDVEMMKEIGYCSGIENYSRYFDGRDPGTRPFCLLDYFPTDFLTIIDESHATIPQIRAMYGGDRSRKEVLVEYGFRLPAALDNRPLKFEEFEKMLNQVIFVSATPADFELNISEGIIVEQIIRPTGLLDPIIEVRPTQNQIDDLLEEIRKVSARDERVLVTTLTKRMAEELAKYLANVGVRCRYIHSDIDTMERVEILRDLRLGLFDVLIGINLLREGLDLPEVSLVAILDADKEGFLRSERSLVQVVGRAARNVAGKAIMYANSITDSMQKTITETQRRRKKQVEYNYIHNITPKSVVKSKNSSSILSSNEKGFSTGISKNIYVENETIDYAADPIIQYMSREDIEKAITKLRKEIAHAAKEMDFKEATKLRDELYALEKKLSNRKN